MKIILSLTALSGALAVMLGAFGAHGLKGRLSEPMLAVFQTGVQYQFYHTLALLGVVILARLLPGQWWQTAAIFMLVGILCFSGSLYALALTGIKWFGPITPFGGLCFILGWLSVLVATIRAEW